MRYLIPVVLIFLASCSNTIYVVRHAEKATPMGNNSDVPLTAEGQRRAESIARILKNKKIKQVFSTNTIRTKSTAQPTADEFKLPVKTYGQKPDSAFIQELISNEINTLVVGHSNTVDDIVNMLCGEKKIAGDLPDSAYNNLYIIKRRGNRFFFKQSYIYSTRTARRRTK